MFIRATPDDVWAILTDDEKTPLWQHFNMRSKTEWVEGGSITFFVGDHPMIVASYGDRCATPFRAQFQRPMVA